jgi:RHS repeat-associated protein
LTNEDGDTAGTYQFDAYGNTTLHTGTTTPMQYAGQYKDEESNLYWMRARYYDPTTGQFLSRDPLTITTGHPYAYVENDPVGGIDAAGLRRGPSLFERGAIVVHDSLHGAANKFVQNHPSGAQRVVDFSAGTLDVLTFGHVNAVVPASAEESWRLSEYFYAGSAFGSAVQSGVPTAGIAALCARGKSLKFGEEGFAALGVGKPFSADQRALVEIAKGARRGVTKEEAATLVGWADELGLKNHGIQAHVGRGFGSFPHVNIGPIKHIRVF